MNAFEIAMYASFVITFLQIVAFFFAPVLLLLIWLNLRKIRLSIDSVVINDET